MSLKNQKYNFNINSSLQGKSSKKVKIYEYNQLKNNNINKNKKFIKKNITHSIEGNIYTYPKKNINGNSNEKYSNKTIIAKKQKKLKEKILNQNKAFINNNKSEENRNIFKTKYDYIIEKSKISNGPVEIPPDIEIQNNLNQKEWSSQKKKLNENVKRSDIIKKIKIFNNKKNNDICSHLLKKIKENEKKLIILPYVKEKQKINKTIHTIGHSNGVTYLKTSLLSGGNENNAYNNFINKIRFDEKTNRNLKERLNLIQSQYANKAEIDLALDENY